MADVIPPAPPTPSLPSTGNAGPVAVTVMSEAAAIVKLVDGALLEAIAQNRAAKGMVEVMTADGLLQLKAQPGGVLPPIPGGSRLLLQMVGQGDAGQLFLLAVNGRPLGGVTLPAQAQALLGLPGLAGGGAGMPAPPTAGRATLGDAFPPGPSVPTPGMAGAGLPGPLGLTATVIRPAQAGGTVPQPGQMPQSPLFGGLPADLPAGTRLTVRIAGILPPTEAGVTTAAPGSPPTIPTVPPGPPPKPGVPSGGPTPQSPLPPVSGTPAPPVLTGTVIAHPPGGHAVVQTPIGSLAVPSHDPLPDGTRLTLEVVGAPIPPSPAAAPPARPEGLTAQGWPALSEALDVLATANQPQALEQLLRVIPQADARLAASMVAFTGAIRNGDTKAVLPDSTVRGLEKAGKKDVASRLKADLEALGEDSGRPVGNGDWRVYAMPFLGGGTIEPVRLFVRKTGDEDGARRDGGGRGNDHRFVVDLNLTQLGRLQLDGLVRREDKLFDLIIRTGEPMSADMRRDILGIFSQASELVGTKGTVSFQAGGRWIDFPPAPPAPTRIEV